MHRSLTTSNYVTSGHALLPTRLVTLVVHRLPCLVQVTPGCTNPHFTHCIGGCTITIFPSGISALRKAPLTSCLETFHFRILPSFNAANSDDGSACAAHDCSVWGPPQQSVHRHMLCTYSEYPVYCYMSWSIHTTWVAVVHVLPSRRRWTHVPHAC